MIPLQLREGSTGEDGFWTYWLLSVLNHCIMRSMTNRIFPLGFWITLDGIASSSLTFARNLLYESHIIGLSSLMLTCWPWRKTLGVMQFNGYVYFKLVVSNREGVRDDACEHTDVDSHVDDMFCHWDMIKPHYWRVAAIFCTRSSRIYHVSTPQVWPDNESWPWLLARRRSH